MIEGGEIIGQGDSARRGGELDESLAQILAARVGIERAVSRDQIDIALIVDRRRGATGPKGSLAAVGSAVIYKHLLQRRRVITDEPAVICAGVAVGGPRGVDDAVQQQQAGALFVISGNECDRGASVARSRNGSFNEHRTSGLLGSRRQVERMQAVRVGRRAARRFHRHGYHVQRRRSRVNDGGARDPDLGNNLITVESVLVRDRAHTGRGVEEADLPEGSGVGLSIIGVEGVHAVVLGGHEDDVVHTFSRDLDSAQIERVGVDVTIHRIGKQLTDLRGVDVRRSELCFAQILPGARQIVVIGEDVDLRRRKHAEQEE